jgi:hypothetical protein
VTDIVRRPSKPGAVELPENARRLIAEVARLPALVMWQWGNVPGGIDGRPHGEIICATPAGQRFGLLAWEGSVGDAIGTELMKLVNQEYHEARMAAKGFVNPDQPTLRQLAPEAFPELNAIDALIEEGEG